MLCQNEFKTLDKVDSFVDDQIKGALSQRRKAIIEIVGEHQHELPALCLQLLPRALVRANAIAR